MNTRKKSGNILLPLLLLLTFLFQQCSNTETERQSLQAHNNMSEENIEQLLTSPNKQVLSRQATVKLSTQSESHSLTAPGYIDFDRTRNQTVSARFGGRIEKLYVKYNLQHVKKGDKILELYSSELNTFQEEHLFLLKSGKEQSLVEQSREKLKLLGVTDNQISQLEKNKTFTQSITVYSLDDGFIFFNTETKSNTQGNVTKQTAVNSMNMAAKNNSEKNMVPSGNQIREGMYINKGEMLFSVNDLQNVWAVVSISSEFYSSIDANGEINIISELLPDKMLTGKIALVESAFEDNKQRFVRVRIILSNNDVQLKINSLVMAEIPLKAKGNFQVPASAVYRTGLSSIVWVKTGTTKNGTGIFRIQKVTTGAVINGMTTVISGLSSNEEVAIQAGLLTDSETLLNNE